MTATFYYTTRWKICQWMKFLFWHSSNSRKLSRQKFQNELACVFTAQMQTEINNNQQMAAFWPIGTAQIIHIVFLIQSEKSSDSGFFTCDPTKKCIMPSTRERHIGILGRGHDLRLETERPKAMFVLIFARTSRGF